jgi:hypothetical protein
MSLQADHTMAVPHTAGPPPPHPSPAGPGLQARSQHCSSKPGNKHLTYKMKQQSNINPSESGNALSPTSYPNLSQFKPCVLSVYFFFTRPQTGTGSP